MVNIRELEQSTVDSCCETAFRYIFDKCLRTFDEPNYFRITMQNYLRQLISRDVYLTIASVGRRSIGVESLRRTEIIRRDFYTIVNMKTSRDRHRVRSTFVFIST